MQQQRRGVKNAKRLRLIINVPDAVVALVRWVAAKRTRNGPGAQGNATERSFFHLLE
jgi:hypothetical protein